MCYSVLIRMIEFELPMAVVIPKIWKKMKLIKCICGKKDKELVLSLTLNEKFTFHSRNTYDNGYITQKKGTNECQAGSIKAPQQ